MSEFACNPGTQKHDLFFLLLLISTLLFLKGEVIVRLFKVLFPTGLVTVYARTIEVYY